MKINFTPSIVAALILCLLISSIILFAFCYKNSYCNDVEVFVKYKEKEPMRNSDGRYLIFSEYETFEITDTFIFWRFDSSDLYGKIEVGKKYVVSTAGWRSPFLSWHRNILSAKRVDE